MKTTLLVFIILASVLGFCGGIFAQTANQYEIRKWTTDGMVSYWITGENSKAFGLNSSGVPAMLSLSGGSTTVAGLTDVALTGLAAGDFWKYDGTDWVNINASAAQTALGLGALATLNAVGSAQITDGAIVDADINPSAGIAYTKMEAGSIFTYSTAGVMTKYATLSAAKATATSGQTIFVGPGTYAVTESLMKDGVNWHFAANATVTRTTTDFGIWYDGGTPMTSVVTGEGSFTTTTTGGDYVSCVQTSDDSTSFTIHARTIGSIQTVGGTGSPISLWGKKGTLKVMCSESVTSVDESAIASAICAYWESGNMHVSCPLIRSDNIAVYPHSSLTSTGDFFVDADLIEGTETGGFEQPGVIFDFGVSSTAASWITARIIKSAGNAIAAVSNANESKLYVTAQKIFGRVENTDFAATPTTTLTYVNADKIEAVGNGSGTAPTLVLNELGTLRVNCRHWSALSYTGETIKQTGGTSYIRGGDFAGGASAKGIEVTGGTASFEAMQVDTSANSSTNGATVSGGTVVFRDVRFASHASGKDVAQSGGTVTVNGGYGTGTGGALTTSGTVGIASIASSGLTVGTTTITSGTSGRVLYNNAGVVGELPLGTLATQDGTISDYLTAVNPTATGEMSLLDTGSGNHWSISPVGRYIEFFEGGGTTWSMNLAVATLSADHFLTIPNADGTFAVSATSPIVLNATTGNLTLGTVPVASGGTAITSYAVGDLIYASGSTTLAKRAAVALGSVLTSAGLTTAPVWSSAPEITSINLGHASDSTITRVSGGVLAIEGNNIIVNGGALGTPSSGTLTNATGLPAAGVVGTAAILGANTFTGAQIITLSPAINTSGLKLDGAWSTAGDTTTDKPQLLIEPSGASSVNWSTLGTGLGINAATGFTGNLVDAKTNGVSKFYVDYQGLAYLTGANGCTFRLTGFAGGAISLGYGAAGGYYNTHDSGIRLDSGSQPFYVWDGGSGQKSIMLDPVNYRIGFGGTISTQTAFIERNADARIGLGKSLASAWVTQYLGASGAIVGTTTNGSPSNDFWITNSVSTGTGASTGAIKLGTYGSNGASGTAIGTVTERVKIDSANVSFTSLPKLPAYTVATLPSTAATGMVTGAMAYVTDATLPTYLGALTGGGAVVCPVFYNGSAWVSH